MGGRPSRVANGHEPLLQNDHDAQEAQENEKLRQAFLRFDTDQDGRLDKKELCKLMHVTGRSQTEACDFLRMVDKRGHITVDFQEFSMIVDAIRQRAKDSEEFTLVDMEVMESKSHLSKIKYALCLVTAYFAIGLCYGAHRRGWSWLKSLYFVVATMTTVGYGDCSFVGPQTDWKDRIFGGIFVFWGVVFIGAAGGVMLEEIYCRAERRRMQALAIEIEKGKLDFTFDLRLEVRRLYKLLLRNIVQIMVTVGVGAMVMSQLEAWDISGAFYWACVTMTTVGYGDLTIDTDAAMAFAVVYILFGFGVLASALSFLGSIPFELKRLKSVDKVLNQFGESLDFKELKALLDCDMLRALRSPLQIEQCSKQPHISRSEFALWLLLKQDRIDLHSDVAQCQSIFDTLDQDGSGVLNQQDIDHYIIMEHHYKNREEDPFPESGGA